MRCKDSFASKIPCTKNTGYDFYPGLLHLRFAKTAFLRNAVNEPKLSQDGFGLSLRGACDVAVQDIDTEREICN